MQRKSHKNVSKRGEKTICVPKEQILKLCEKFCVSENTVYNALRYDMNSEKSIAIREAVFNSGNAKVQTLRPMMQYDIYVSKELSDPISTSN